MEDSTSTSTSGSFLAAARAILAEAGHPLHPREITERALSAGLVQTTGKTPAATMAAQLYTNIKRHGPRSSFVQAGKGRFGLRTWSVEELPNVEPLLSPRTPTTEPAPVIERAHDAAEYVVAELLATQHETCESIRFERARAEAFTFLGVTARHVGGAGQTDIVLDASITGAPYRVVVDAKSSKHGKVADAGIDWLSLTTHRKLAQADHILVVAPGFGGGYLRERADDHGVALLTAEEMVELVRLHHATPFSLLDLRVLFLTPGPVTAALDQLRESARATSTRWQLLREIIDLVQDLPAGAYPDTQNLWLLLSYQRKQNAPTLDDVADAVAILASRAVGILKPNNGGYLLTMQADTALKRLQALSRTIVADPPPQSAQPNPGEQATPPPA